MLRLSIFCPEYMSLIFHSLNYLSGMERSQKPLENYLDRGVFYYAAPGKFLFEMDSVGRFLVTDGKEIIVEKQENAKDSDINLFLLGSVMGAAILQRGLIPLHGSTVVKGNRLCYMRKIRRWKIHPSC